MSRNKQQGFTLIELVMVIVILGILAAIALPKFANLSQDARFSTLLAAQGSFKAAAAIAHAKFLIDPSTITIEGTTVAYVNGYPNLATIGNLAGLDSSYGYTVGTGVLVVSSIAGCTFTYNEAAANAAPTYTAVSANSSVC